MTYWLGALQDKLPSYLVSWPLALWQWRCNGFSLSRDISRSRELPSCQVWWSQALWQWRYNVLVAEDETSRSSRFNPPLLFNFSRTWFKSARHIILMTPILVTRCQSSNWTNTGKLLLPVRQKFCREGEKEKEKQLQSVMR